MKKSMILLFSIISCFLFKPDVNAEGNYVAQIGDTKYVSVQDALQTIQNGEELILLKDAGSIDILESQEITINLNNYKVSSINNYGKLTLKNGTVSYSIYVNGINNKENATLIVDGVRFLSDANITVSISNNGTVTVQNMTCGSSTSNVTQCIQNSPTGVMTINDGTYYAKQLFINYGTLTINGGTFEAEGSQNNATLIINNGNFHSTKDEMITNTRGNVIINNGTFTGAGVASNYDPNYLYNTEQVESTITVNNGTFNVSGTAFDNTAFSAYSNIKINGGNIISENCLVANHGKNSNKIYINGGELTYTGVENGEAIYVYDGSLIIGENDNIVSPAIPTIHFNGGVLSTLGAINFEFYDGKIILKKKLNVDGFEQILLPEGYYIKYDDNGDSTYTAYLAKTEKNTPDEPTPEPTQPKVEVTPNVETTVENPKTGLYVSLGVLVIAICSGVFYIVYRKKNYFNKI